MNTRTPRRYLGAALALAALLSCRAGKETAVAPADSKPGVPHATRTPEAQVAPARPAQVAAPAHPPTDDVVRLTDKTRTGGSVIRIGQPKLRLASDNVSTVQISHAAELAVVADHDHSIGIWNTNNGTLVNRIRNPKISSGEIVQEFALSPSGRWLAVRFDVRVYLLKYPFDAASIQTPCYAAYAFSSDDKLLLCSTSVPHVLDIEKNRFVASVPDDRFRDVPKKLSFSQDWKSIYWATKNKLLRWDFAGAGSISEIYSTPLDIKRPSFSSHADAVIISEKRTLYRMDLLSGAKSQGVDSATLFYAVSPAGNMVAISAKNGLRFVDMIAGRELPPVTIKGSIYDIAYSEDDNLLAFVHDPSARSVEEDALLQVLDLRTGLRTYDAPSRFVGWLSGDTAAIELGGAYTTLAAATFTRGVTDAAAVAAVALKPPAGAPPWAEWVSQGPGGALIVSEKRLRSAAPPDRRYSIECEPTMRLWLPPPAKAGASPGGAAAASAGHEKVLTLTCTDKDLGLTHSDPGWYHDAGWIVGLSTTTAKIYNARGKEVARLDVGHPAFPKPEFRHEYWNLALSPTGKHLAVLWRRADYGGDQPPTFDPRRDAQHLAEAIDRIDCQRDWLNKCKMEYFLEIWSLSGKPKRIWKERLSLPEARTRTFFEPKIPSGPITFDRTGERVLVGFRDGDILIRSLSDQGPDLYGAKATGPLETLHQVPVTKILVSPDNRWVFSEDSSSEQRIWALPAR